MYDFSDCDKRVWVRIYTGNLEPVDFTRGRVTVSLISPLQHLTKRDPSVVDVGASSAIPDAHFQPETFNDNGKLTWLGVPLTIDEIESKYTYWEANDRVDLTIVPRLLESYDSALHVRDFNDVIDIETNDSLSRVLHLCKFNDEITRAILSINVELTRLVCFDGKGTEVSVDTKRRFLLEQGLNPSIYLEDFDDWFLSNPFNLEAIEFEKWKRSLHFKFAMPKSLWKSITPVEDFTLYDVRTFSFDLNKEINDYDQIIANQYWTETHIDFSLYAQQWLDLPQSVRDPLYTILLFFSNVDTLVNDNLINKNLSQLQMRELKHLYTKQVAIEDIHSKVYGLLLEKIPADSQGEVLKGVRGLFNEGLQLMNGFIETFSQEGMSVANTLVAFYFVEGLLFQLPFMLICEIFRNGSPHKLDALVNTNNLIMRDEYTHVKIAQIAMRVCKNKLMSPQTLCEFGEYCLSLAMSIFQPLFVKYPKIGGMDYYSTAKFMRGWLNHLLLELGMKTSDGPQDMDKQVQEMLDRILNTNSSQEKTLFLETSSSNYTFSKTSGTQASGECSVCTL